MKAPRYATVDLYEVALDNLTAEEVGAYALLLKACFANGGQLPGDTKTVHFWCKIGRRKWPRIWAKLSPLFYQDGQHILRSQVVDFRLQRIDALSEVRRQAANARHAKGHANAPANAPPIAMQMPLQMHMRKQRTEKIPLSKPSETPPPRPRVREAPQETKKLKKLKAVFGSDPAARNGHATTERSSTPGFKHVAPSQVTPATAALMSKCARFVGEDKAPEFWAEMMGPDAATVLANTAKAMRDSGWEDAS